VATKSPNLEKNAMRISAAIAATAILAMAAGAAHADVQKYKANLTGAAEVPANASTARGVVTGVFETDTGEFDYTVTYSGLSGPATGAGFHTAAKGAAGPLALALPNPAAPVSGSVKLNPQQVRDLNSGLLYFDVETGANPNGEIRGQIRRDY
jgi:hypothetical protein